MAKNLLLFFRATIVVCEPSAFSFLNQPVSLLAFHRGESDRFRGVFLRNRIRTIMTSLNILYSYMRCKTKVESSPDSCMIEINIGDVSERFDG